MAHSSSRFNCASFALDLKRLLGQSRSALSLALATALIVHLSYTRIRSPHQQHQAPKPLTTRFVKRQPRLSKPLELKKRPRPKRRQLQREMVAVKAHAPRQDVSSGMGSARMLRSLARPRVGFGRWVGYAAEVVEPQAIAQRIEGSREGRHTLDSSLEMMNIEALDTGQYQAMVIQDPDDRRNIRGYLHLAIAYPFSARQREWHQGEDRLMWGIRRLVRKLNAWTDINTTIAKRVTFDSPEFFSTPWVYLRVVWGLRPTSGEVHNLGRYLLAGGFFFFEGTHWRELQGERHAAQFVESALESQGRRKGVHWEYAFLPNSHPIFHCYYDFPNGPPPGSTVVYRHLYGSGRDDEVEPWARGVEIKGALVVLNTNQAYCGAWAHWGTSTSPYLGATFAGYDPTLPFRFGINTIIFALTQEGSITRRVMDSVR